MRIRSRIAVVAMPVLALSLASCGRGNGPPLYPVHGKVMHEGQAAAGATVMFRREVPSPTRPRRSRRANRRGGFPAGRPRPGRRAPAGNYAVLIQWRTRTEGTDAPKPVPKKGRRYVVPAKPDGVPDRLEGRYMNAEKSKFHVEVKPGENNLEPFDVSK